MDNIKYTISGVQQHKLIELGLDIKDASIITYIRDIIASGRLIKKKIEGEVFYWINTEKLIEYLPILNISNSKVMGRRYKNYEKLGLITRHIHKHPMMGSYLFIKPLDGFYNLFEVIKAESNEEELRAEYERLGLEYEPLEGTQKYPRGSSKKTSEIKEEEVNSRGNSKVPSVELKSSLCGTEKFPHNYPYKYTPNNNTKSKSKRGEIDLEKKEDKKKYKTKPEVIKVLFEEKKIKIRKDFLEYLATNFYYDEILWAYEKSIYAENIQGHMRTCLVNLPKGRSLQRGIKGNEEKEEVEKVKVTREEVILTFLEIDSAKTVEEMSQPNLRLLNKTLINSGYERV